MKKPRKTIKLSAYPTKNWTDNLSGNTEVPRVLSRIAGYDYAANSLRAIHGDISGFLTWYVEKNKEAFSFERITSHDVSDYRDDLIRRGRKPSSINRKIISLRRFFALAMEEDLLSKNPCTSVKRAVMQRLAPKSLTPQDTRKLLKEVEIRGKQRDKVLIELMLGAGLRVSEVVNLTRDDIELSERKGHLVIRSSKGNKTRLVPLGNNLRTMLREYLREHTDAEHVFTGQRGALKTIAINKIVGKYAEKAGVALSPHTLRHTFSCNYLRGHPGDIVSLAQILGHSNVNTTAIYTQNSLEDLQEKMERVTY